ncbi:MAG: phage baseplate assembly protein W [Crocinitomicaceae bacterium]|jgi:phage baseplate assembly protein W
MNKRAFLQTGWPFNPVVGKDASSLENISYDQDIAESLQILFTTLPGERMAHPMYGCDLMRFMFRPINNSLLTDMEHSIRTAIILYEPRIQIVELLVRPHEVIPHQLDIYISYILSKTNSRFNMTIPFYTMGAEKE